MELSTSTHKKRETGRIQTIVTIVVSFLAIAAAAFVLGTLGIFRAPVAAAPVGQGSGVVQTEGFRFNPGVIRLTAGEEMTLNLSNADMVPHSFDVDDLNLHIEMPVNAPISVTFTATEPGEYQIYCSIPGHTESGMVGTLTIEAP